MATQAQGTQHNITPMPGFSEAPASINVRVVSPSGYDYQITMRANRVGDLLGQARQLEVWLSENGWQPAATRPAATSNGQAQTESAPLCAIHKTVMTKRSRDGRSWWSCPQKLDTGEWCPYRPKGGTS